jgi:hypothetical protein
MAQVTLAVNFVAFGPVMTVAVLFIKFVVFAVVIASLGVCVVAIVNTGGCSGYVWAAVWLVFVTVLALVVGLLLWLLAFTMLLSCWFYQPYPEDDHKSDRNMSVE